MSGLIRRAELFNELAPVQTLAEAYAVIQGMPEVDAVEVVRCKGCKNSQHWYRDRRRCFLWNEDGVSVFDSGFCNYGEWKDGDENGKVR